jgi:L-ascorbate metabolism protein UlaG (beta-lactamase superfamily)
MLSTELKIKYIGGPTALFEAAGLRFLTDPTFDPKGSEYKTPIYTLHKLSDPAISIDELGEIDFVLLSHAHHFDNLDNTGKMFLPKAGKVYTTIVAAERLGGNALGLENWESINIPTKDGRTLQITGTPARHGPAGGDRGPCTGFVLNFSGEDDAIYISGDTVWYEGVAEIAERFNVKIAILFMGAAVVKEVGTAHLTMTAEEGITAAKHFPGAKIIPLHFEGWGHFSESYNEIQSSFEKAGIANRLLWAD